MTDNRWASIMLVWWSLLTVGALFMFARSSHILIEYGGSGRFVGTGAWLALSFVYAVSAVGAFRRIDKKGLKE